MKCQKCESVQETGNVRVSVKGEKQGEEGRRGREMGGRKRVRQSGKRYIGEA